MSVPTTILLVDDEPGIRRSLGEALKDEGYHVVKAERGEQAIDLLHNPDGEGIQLMLLDVWLPGQDGLETLKQAKQVRPDLPVVMISGHASIDTALQATKLGAFDFLEKPIDLDRLLLVTGNALRQSKLERENLRLQAEVEGGRFFLADSPAMKRLMADVALVAPTEGRVLLTGENGSGKEEVARLIHQQSARREAPFVEVNCAAIPEELIESELFGHEKGSFTGATEKQIGKFELAHKGTIFLDEVGDMSLRTQAKVLRVLQEGEVERIGSQRTIQVDVRVIAATNKNLSEGIEKGQFREDLYFRLSVIPIQIPPLRERPDDIPLLVQHFVRQFCLENNFRGKSFSPEAVELLKRQPWRGNVRELRNAVERLLIMVEADVISADEVSEVARPLGRESSSATSLGSLRDFKEQSERAFLVSKLRECGWNISATAAAIGTPRSNLYKKLEQYEISEEHDG
jgi:two-component system nitrogen regulation response regulator NtrX